MIIQASEFLTEYYKSNANKDSIIRYLDLIVASKDSVYNEEKLRKLEELRIGEIFRQEKLKLQQKKDKEYRKRNLQLGLIAAVVPIFAAIVFFLGRRNRKNSKIILTLGLTSLLMLFEFVSLIVHPSLEKIAHHNLLLMYAGLLIIASILVPSSPA
jgi:hypothetical protein